MGQSQPFTPNSPKRDQLRSELHELQKPRFEARAIEMLRRLRDNGKVLGTDRLAVNELLQAFDDQEHVAEFLSMDDTLLDAEVHRCIRTMIGPETWISHDGGQQLVKQPFVDTLRALHTQVRVHRAERIDRAHRLVMESVIDNYQYTQRDRRAGDRRRPT